MTAPDFDDKLLERLFPAPSFSSAFTSRYAPTPNAGITPESTEMLRKLLKENHRRFHVFFNHKGFHNHLTHHLFAAYGLGAPPSILQAAFDEHASYQRPAFKSPEPVTRNNWTKFLGDENFYNAYMNFFQDEIEKNGLEATFQQFIFSHDANWAGDEPRMLDRFLAGLLHPMIHFGHAAEFGVPGMAIEGLAQAAIHKISYSELWGSDFFDHASDGAPTASYLSSLTNALTLTSPATTVKPHTHSLTILSRVLADKRLEAGQTCRFESESKFTDTLKSSGEILREYAALWTVGTGKEEIQERVEELQWFVTVVFGLGGWKKGREFRADFFLVHLVTSDLFIQSVLSLLKPSQQANLLKAYFAAALGYFVSRGRPSIDVKEFFEHTSADPKPPSDSESASSGEQVGNPWYPLLTSTLPHKDEHHVKAERALAHGAALYGARPRGFFNSKNTELEDAEYLDGTLFVRVGGLLMGAMKWEHALVPGGSGKTGREENDDEEAGWHRAGLGWD